MRPMDFILKQLEVGWLRLDRFSDIRGFTFSELDSK